ncbi:partial GTPase Der, partial [uncultured bacterium]
MLPVIALVGRPNVGKSTLFNYLTKSREALVADYPGLTRDRQYGHVKRGTRPCLVVDTGGIADDAEGIDSVSRKQVQIALEEADVVLFMVDAREGLSASDNVIAQMLRRLNKPVLLVTNKTDGLDITHVANDFYSLALGEPMKIS